MPHPSANVLRGTTGPRQDRLNRGIPVLIAFQRAPSYFFPQSVSTTDSKYVERKAYLSQYVHERTLAVREAAAKAAAASGNEAAWLRSLQEELPRFLPF